MFKLGRYVRTNIIEIILVEGNYEDKDVENILFFRLSFSELFYHEFSRLEVQICICT